MLDMKKSETLDFLKASFKDKILSKSTEKNNKIVIGYSGGIDSHVLLHLSKFALKNTEINIQAIHINHKLQKKIR